MVTRVPHGGEGKACQVVAVVFYFGADDVGFIPHRGLGVGHVGIVAEDHLSRGCLVLTDDPGIGAEPLGNGAQGIQLVHASGDA